MRSISRFRGRGNLHRLRKELRHSRFPTTCTAGHGNMPICFITPQHQTGCQTCRDNRIRHEGMHGSIRGLDEPELANCDFANLQPHLSKILTRAWARLHGESSLSLRDARGRDGSAIPLRVLLAVLQDPVQPSLIPPPLLLLRVHEGPERLLGILCGKLLHQAVGGYNAHFDGSAYLPPSPEG
jgi:hypothetical protein